MGSGPGDIKEISSLNRIIRYTPRGYTCEGDQRHAEILIAAFDLEGCRPIGVPGVKAPNSKEEIEDPALEPGEARRFRALAARANYMALDRPDIGFACKEVCKDKQGQTRTQTETRTTQNILCLI